MTRQTRLRWALALNLAVVIAQLLAGLAARSLGLLADAGHNLTDAAAIVLALVAVRLASRARTAQRSFGWHRSAILAAQANAAGILLVTAVIAVEALHRLAHPHALHAGVVVVVAAGALVANAAAAILLHERTEELNMRAARLHMVGDAATSACVLAAGAAMAIAGGWYVLDPVVSLVVSAVIAWRALRLLARAADVLLESTPSGLDVGLLESAMGAVPGVEGVHDLHAWSLSSEVTALSAHLVLAGHPSLEEAQAVGEAVKDVVRERFGIAHATLELECEVCAVGEADPCAIEELPTRTTVGQGS